MSTPQDRARTFLKHIGGVIGRELTAGDQIDSQIVSLDIEKVRLLANAGLHWAKERDDIKAACKMLGIDEDKWCRDTWGRSIVTLRGYRQVGREWDRYVTARRELGSATGETGMDLARSLVPMNARAMNARHSSDHYGKLDMSRCQCITDDALSAFRKMPSESVDVIPTSPPYYPLRRLYGGRHGGRAVGWEPSVEEYLTHLVTIFHEARRVLAKRGTLIIIMKDAYSTTDGARYRQHTHRLRRPNQQKEWMPDGTPIQRGDRPTGNLLLIPTRFAIKMQDDGWYLRMLLPVRIKGHPESVDDRTTHDYEWVLVFTKQRRYFWNKDAIREPLADESRPGKLSKNHKGGVIRKDKARDVRIAPNPNGRNSSSVLEFNPSNYRGKHTATTSEALAHWILSAACDDNAHVCDPFGGAATFAMIALQMGYRATSIDIFGDYTNEAIERLSNAPAKLPVDRDAE